MRAELEMRARLLPEFSSAALRERELRRLRQAVCDIKVYGEASKAMR